MFVKEGVSIKSAKSGAVNEDTGDISKLNVGINYNRTKLKVNIYFLFVQNCIENDFGIFSK